jgi:hypothetical protein
MSTTFFVDPSAAVETLESESGAFRVKLRTRLTLGERMHMLSRISKAQSSGTIEQILLIAAETFIVGWEGADAPPFSREALALLDPDEPFVASVLQACLARVTESTRLGNARS